LVPQPVRASSAAPAPSAVAARTRRPKLVIVMADPLLRRPRDLAPRRAGPMRPGTHRAKRSREGQGIAMKWRRSGCWQGARRAERPAGRMIALRRGRSVLRAAGPGVAVIAAVAVVLRILLIAGAARVAEPQGDAEPGADREAEAGPDEEVVEHRQADPDAHGEADHHPEGEPGGVEAAAGWSHGSFVRSDPRAVRPGAESSTLTPGTGRGPIASRRDSHPAADLEPHHPAGAAQPAAPDHRGARRRGDHPRAHPRGHLLLGDRR